LIIIVIYIQIFAFREKRLTIKKFIVNKPTTHRTVFKYEIEQKIESKLKKLDSKKQLSFMYSPPLKSIFEDPLQE